MVRYLVRTNPKDVNDVFIWTEMLSRRKELEEVWATDPKAALKKDPLPDARTVSLEQMEAMTKADLMIFAKVRLGNDLDPTLKKEDLLDQVKMMVYTHNIPEGASVPGTLEMNRPRGNLPT